MLVRKLRRPQAQDPPAIPTLRVDPDEPVGILREAVARLQNVVLQLVRDSRLTSNNPPVGHSETHRMQTGVDALDGAAPNTLSLANATGTPVEGTSEYVARADHSHGTIKRDVRVKNVSGDVGTRNAVKLLAGTAITRTVADDGGNDLVSDTVAVTGAPSAAGQVWYHDGSTQAGLAAPTVDGDLLTADTTLPGKVKWATPAAAVAALDDLTDVDTTGVSDGDVLTYDSGSGTWVADTAPAGGGGGGGGSGLKWTKYTYAYTDFSAAATTASANIAIPADTVVHGVWVKTSEAFAGTGITAWSCSVGAADGPFSRILAKASAYYLLNEATGATRVDATGRGNDLSVISGTPAQCAGVTGKAARFITGSSEMLGCDSTADLQTGDVTFTITAWVYAEGLGVPYSIVTKESAGGGTREYVLYSTPSGSYNAAQIGIFRATDNVTFAITSYYWPLGTWHFIRLWHDKDADTINICLDEGEVSSAATGGALQAASTGKFRIGGSDKNNQYLSGRVQHVGIFKSLLSQADIAYLYNNGSGPPADGGTTQWIDNYDLMGTVNDSHLLCSRQFPRIEDTGGYNLTVTVNSVGANLDQGTAGSLDVWVLTNTAGESIARSLMLMGG